MHVLIIGGGIAGAGAAWDLLKTGARVTVVESEAELGGRARTFQWQGQWAIRGASRFISSEANLKDLARELGLLTPGLFDEGKNYAYPVLIRNERVETVDDLTPVDILKSKILPTREKIALAGILPDLLKQMSRNDPCDPTSAADFDTQTACAYFRTVSPAFADYILQPTMGGFCGYREADFSLAWVLWLMAGRNWAENWWAPKERGVGGLPHALEQALAARDRCVLLRSTKALEVRTSENGVRAVTCGPDGETVIEADAVVLAVPGPLVNPLMPDLDPARRAFFDEVRYVGHHVAHIMAEAPQVPCRPIVLLPAVDGHDCLPFIALQHLEGGRIWFHSEMDGDYCARTLGAPEDQILDDAWEVVVRQTPALKGQRIIDRRLVRNDLGIPSRYVGYTRALKAFRKLGSMPRVAFAGDYLINSTVGQAHKSGLIAAEDIKRQLGVI